MDKVLVIKISLSQEIQNHYPCSQKWIWVYYNTTGPERISSWLQLCL